MLYFHRQNTIKAQAHVYADTVRATGVKTLFFYPLKKSPLASTNRFRYEVLLNLGARFEGFGSTRKSRTEQMQADLESQGYTFIDVDLDDYDPAIYRELITREVSL